MKLKKYYYLFITCIVALAIWSCNKNDAVPVTGSTSLLNVINEVTDIKAIDFYLNGTRQNTSSAVYLFNTSGYLSVPTGAQQYQFKSDTDRTLLADITLSPPKADSSYTLVVTGQQSKNNFTTIFLSDYFIIDTVSTHAKVRFVQASPGANNYDVFVGDTLSFKNQAFKTASGFKGVGAGKKTVKVLLAGTSTSLFNGTVIIQPGSYYTLLTEGVPGGTGNNAFGVSVNLSR